MAGIRRVDGDSLWIPTYGFAMQTAVAKQASARVRSELEQEIHDEIRRLYSVAIAIKTGETTRVPGTNTLFILPNKHKALLYSDDYHSNDTVYYESSKDCGALAYKKWVNLDFEERNRGNGNILKQGRYSKTSVTKVKKTVVTKSMEPSRTLRKPAANPVKQQNNATKVTAINVRKKD